MFKFEPVLSRGITALGYYKTLTPSSFVEQLQVVVVVVVVLLSHYYM